MHFDSDRQLWTSRIPTPHASTVELHGAAFLHDEANPGLELAALDTSLRVSDKPPPPGLTWAGQTNFEGTGSSHGAIRVTPQATVTGAQYCVTIPDGAIPVRSSANDSQIGELTVERQQSCGPADVDKPFDIAANLTIDDEANTSAEIVVPVGSEYVDPSGVRVQLASDTPADIGRVVLTRSPDRGRELLIVGALIAASVLLPLVLLWLANFWQGRLTTPDDLRVSSIPVLITAAEATRSKTYRINQADSAEIRLNDRRPVAGSRRKWNLPAGISVARRVPLNPFGMPRSIIRSSRGGVASSVGRGSAAGGAHGPVRFEEAVVVSYASGTAPNNGSAVPAEAAVISAPGRRPQDLERLLHEGLAKCAPQVQFEERPEDHRPEPPEPRARQRAPEPPRERTPYAATEAPRSSTESRRPPSAPPRGAHNDGPPRRPPPAPSR